MGGVRVLGLRPDRLPATPPVKSGDTFVVHSIRYPSYISTAVAVYT